MVALPGGKSRTKVLQISTPIGSSNITTLFYRGGPASLMIETTENDRAMSRELTVVLTVLGLAGGLWLLVAAL